MIGFKIEYIDEKFNVKQLCTLEWAIKKFRGFETTILLTSSNNQISEFRIPNIYNEFFVLIFLMILRTHFEASLRFRKN